MSITLWMKHFRRVILYRHKVLSFSTAVSLESPVKGSYYINMRTIQ